MARIGYLKNVAVGSRVELHGEMQTMQMRLRIKLIESDRKPTEKHPDYVVCAVADHGDIPIGAAWKKTKTGDASREFLSLAIDDPSFKTRLNVTAFKNDEGGYDLTWSRPQKKAVS
jgi:uncharacterized protein (DUF736 family)